MTEESCPAFKEVGPYEVALSRAWEDLSGRKAQEVALASAASFADGRFHLKTLGRDCVVDMDHRTILLAGREPQPLAKMVILHYLGGCPPIAPTGKTVSYRDLPNGQIFYPAFKKRVVDPIAFLFRSQPQLLASAGSRLGGKQLQLGSSSILLHPLPKLPVTVIIWKADKEVQGSANLLFDETAGRVLPPEDLAEVGWFVFSELRKTASVVRKELMDHNEI